MNLSIVFNICALAASIIALVVSAFLAFRQFRLMRHANQVPVIIDLFREMRADTFIVREQEIWHSLPGDKDPSKGFEGLPVPLRTYVYDICLFYQTVAYLVNFKMIDSRLAYTALHYRMLRTWASVGPFVRGERVIRGGENTFLNSFETVAENIEREHLKRDGEEVLVKIREEVEGTRSNLVRAPGQQRFRLLRNAWRKLRIG